MPTPITQMSLDPTADNDDTRSIRSTSSTLVGSRLYDNGNINEHEADENEHAGNDHVNTRTYADEAAGERDNSAVSVVRHGFAEEYFDEYAQYEVRWNVFAERRYETMAKPNPTADSKIIRDWRLREKVKTVSGLLLVCLNIGVDPPDIVKTNPCAKTECWVDPTLLAPAKALEAIGKNLQLNYENINVRTRFKQSMDPTVEDTKKFCCQMRRTAKDERILFHYNGHGVPKPTSSGEIWVFNKNYTQYIPVSLFDLQMWLGSPAIFVWDCSAAGNIVTNFNRFAEQRDAEAARSSTSQQHPGQLPLTPFRECIQLAACGPNEILPMNPELPADVFTSCLTTPIIMSLRWFVMQNPLLTKKLNPEKVAKLPGRTQDRRTPLGELNWIFTAVTDTIAWNVLQDEPELFKRLFRQDLMVASMFRNFLLAERIMRSHQCVPVSTPALPPTYDHPMWNAWDLAVDMCLAQLPKLLAAQEGGPEYIYENSTFFSEQLTAFEVWLARGSVYRKVPAQLPIVLQVLLSQVHRLRALILLSKFLDLGPWAVNQALSVGIFPYVLKLLQSPAAELKPVLIFIWARILAVDKSCQTDLLKDHVYTYFINILGPHNATLAIPHVAEHRAMCAFILSVFCADHPTGQQECFRQNVLKTCLNYVDDQDPLLRQWVCLFLGQLWTDYPDAKWVAITESAHDQLFKLLDDPIPDVRASAIYALGLFIGNLDRTEQVVNIEHNIGIAVVGETADGSPIVRKELVVALSRIVHFYFDKFVEAASELLEEERQRQAATSTTLDSRRGRSDGRPNLADSTFRSMTHGTVYTCIWKALLNLSVDPHPEVSEKASIIVDHVNYKLISDNLVGDKALFLAQQPQTPPSYRTMTPTFDRSHSHQGIDSRNGTTKSLGLTRSTSLIDALRGYVDWTLHGAQISSPPPPPAINLSNDKQPQRSLSTHHERAATVHGPPSRSTSTGIPSLTEAVSMALREKNNSQNLEDEMDDDGVLPFKSELYDWSCEYFTAPQMRPPEDEEPGSEVYNERLWRRMRNDEIVYTTQMRRYEAGNHPWDIHSALLNNEIEPAHLRFHQFEPHIASADKNHTITVWDWKQHQKINVIRNANPPRSRITALNFINEDDVAMLLTGSDEGVIRIYRHYDSYEDTKLVSSWRALTDLNPNKRGSAMVCDWQQSRGILLVSGDVKSIKIWDVTKERCIEDIPTRVSSGVTSITSDQVAGHILVVSHDDGAIKVYDRRIQHPGNSIMTWREHRAKVLEVHMQKSDSRELVSGSVQGDIKLWDIRYSRSLRTIEAHSSVSMTALSIHDSAPVISSGGENHYIKIWNMKGELLSTLRPTMGFLGQYVGPVSSLAFHPHHAIVAAGGDQYISIYECNIKGPQLY